MTKALFTTCTSVAISSIVTFSCHAQSFCCDPDSDGGVASPSECLQEDGGYLASDGFVCDPDCSEAAGGVDPECTTIPLDGGLSLLALAGGGLATAAMRRRREEEARQADES